MPPIAIPYSLRFLAKEKIIGAICTSEYVDFDQFISQLEPVLSIIIKENKLCYIEGDFNLDLLK